MDYLSYKIFYIGTFVWFAAGALLIAFVMLSDLRKNKKIKRPGA